MELRHLRYFVAAGKHEHFGRAAERLSVVQPALSRQIAELEAEIGTPLFERLPRGVRLTAAGREFLCEAEDLLSRVHSATQRARDVGAGKSGRLRIGFVDTAIYNSSIPRIFAEFRRRFPGVHLELSQLSSLQQGEGLGSGLLNLGLVYHRPTLKTPLGHHLLLTETVMLAVPVRHRLARRREVRLTDLKDEAFIWIPRAVSPPYYDRIHAACRRRGFSPWIVQEGETDLTILSLVATGAGVSFCTSSTAHRKPRGVRLLPIADLRLTLRLEAVWRRDDLNPALQHFVAMLP